MNVELIARICHEANRAYCAAIGDHSQVDWDSASDWQKDSARDGVLFHIQTLEKGERPLPSASHENWLAQKQKDGWKYGPIKDADKKEHPCFVAYDDLPVERKAKDYIFAGVVEAFFIAQQKGQQ